MADKKLKIHRLLAIVAVSMFTIAVLSIQETNATTGFLQSLSFFPHDNSNFKLSSLQHLIAKRGVFSSIFGSSNEKCPRGSYGSPGNCQPCGECFDQWADEIDKLRNATQALLDRVKFLLQIGTVGAYAKEFGEIEAMLERIKQILDSQQLNEQDILELEKQLEEMMARLKALEKLLLAYELSADSTVNRTNAVNDALNELEKFGDKLELMIEKLRENATQFQEANVDGAYQNILNAQNRSREAENAVRNLKPTILEQEKKRRLTENLISSMTMRFNSSIATNEALLAELARQILLLENNVPGINHLVCASNSTVNFCDQLCGGSLCGKCGGLSCSEGATTRAANALDLAQQATALLNSKYNEAKLNLEELNKVKNISDEALKQAKAVLEECELQRLKFDKIAKELNAILDGIDKFALVDGARPAEVRTLGLECLQLSISLRPEQIIELAKKINETLASLTNIDKILAETANDLATAEQLHQQADRAKEIADGLLETVQLVLRMLEEAAREQARAAAAIAAAAADIEGAQNDLKEIGSSTDSLTRRIDELFDILKKLRNRFDELRKKYAQNELFVSQAKSAAEEAGKLTDEAERVTDELAAKVREAELKLRDKLRANGENNERAERFRNDALQFAADIKNKSNILRELDDLFDDFVKRVLNYQDTVDDLNKQMDTYLRDIDLRAQYYRECQP